jgi:glyoxylase-like metal-dependent hydrolase (beta-lactamase superfamily II)
MRLHVLEQGYIEAKRAVFLTEQGERELVTTTWPVRCYLCEHSDGWLLWDTGLPEADLVADPWARGGWKKVVTSPLVQWLAGLGISPHDITYLGLSHLHIDHAGNANPFASATVLIGAREQTGVLKSKGSSPYFPDDFAMLRESRTILVDDTHDVFGDGAAVIYAAPGHTPGHQILVLTMPNQEPLILVGDAFYAPEDLTHRRAPEWNDDFAETFRTMERIERLAAEMGARLVIHHDLNS